MVDIDRVVIESSGLFDRQWYASTYAGSLAEHEDPYEHFMRVGADLLYRPNPLFDVSYYSEQAAIVASGLNPLIHYIRQGSDLNFNPHPLFDSVWYRKYISQKWFCFSQTLLGHFLHVGRQQGLKPNALFDGDYYLSSNPDIESAGCDPLYHFELWGEAEGRQPAAYVTVPILETIARVHGAETGTGSLVGRIVRRNPGVPFETLAVEAAEAETRSVLRNRDFEGRERRSILVICHRLGGGVRRHVDDRIRDLRHDCNVAVLTASATDFALRLYGRASDREILISSLQRPVLVRIFKDLNIKIIEIHHIHGFNNLADLIDVIDAPIDLYVHDYYLISPQPHLVGPDLNFVGEDIELHHDLLRRASIVPLKTTVRSWQRAHRWLFEKARRVIAPSHDTARRVGRTYPWCSISVVPYETFTAEMSLRQRPKSPRFQMERRFKVALLGYLQEHKGLRVACAVSDLARRKGLNIEFVVIGYCHDIRGSGKNFRVTGPYADSELEGILLDEDPDLVWYPAQCPETWSYTLTAALRLGLPVLCSDIGAFKERICGLENCRTFCWDASAIEWLICMSDQLDRLSGHRQDHSTECDPLEA